MNDDPNFSPTPTDRLIRDKEVENLTGLKRNIRYQLEAAGEFPRRRKITERLTAYSYREVRRWVDQKLATAPFVDYGNAAAGKAGVE